MKVSQLGEFGLIARLAALIERRSNRKTAAWNDLVIGIGDDAAAWNCRPGNALITTDVLVENVHFDFSYTGWRDLGWKSIAINVSDIYAMGGTPQYALISLALPGTHSVADVLEMYEGMIQICNRYGVALAGGNVSSSEKVTVNVTLTGIAGKNMLTRSAARPGDLIGVFGYPGLSAAALKALQSKIAISENAMKAFGKAHLHPSPRLDSGPALAACGVKAAIDTSDGLLSDLGHICEASASGAVLYEQNLPVHPLLKKYFKNDYLDLVLAGGEDYELLFTAREDVMQGVIDSMPSPPAVIGEITGDKQAGITVLDSHGQPIKLKYKGWDHYKSPVKHG